MARMCFCLLLTTLNFFSITLATNDLAPDHSSQNPQRAQGDLLFDLDVSAITGSTFLLGVELAADHYWVTAAGISALADANFLHQIDLQGNLVNTFPQPTTSDWGWRDLAFDGAFLYASDSAVIEQISLATGQPTGVTIPSPVNPARGLAYDPASDHFWTANWNSDLYEIDRNGTIINSYPNAHFIYGLAWDPISVGGPFLWSWHQDDAMDAHQFHPASGTETGLTFRGVDLGTAADVAGGATINPTIVPGNQVMIVIQQAAPGDFIAGYELGPAPFAFIPTLGTVGLAAFVVLLLTCAVWMSRRRRLRTT